MAAPPVPLVGDCTVVPCLDGDERPYLSFDAAASTAPLPEVCRRVDEFLPWYSSVHRGAGQKSQVATAAYEDARRAMLGFAGRGGDDVAIFCRNTTEALNILAHRLRFRPGDVVVTSVVEHHANLLPWQRAASCRFVECGPDGTFSVESVERVLDDGPAPRLLAVTGASNITGWLPPVDDLIGAAHRRGIPVAVDGAQLAPHRPLPAGADFVAWSGHKMYAPFGAGVLVGPRAAFTDGEPFVVGGGAVDLVDLDDVVWTGPPEREEAGSPNVVGAVALHAAVDALAAVGWPAIVGHDRDLAGRLHRGLGSVDGVTVLGESTDGDRWTGRDALPVVTFAVRGVPHALVAARLAAEEAIGVRHGCFCAHPYLMRLLGLGRDEVARYRSELRRGDRSRMPGAVRASAGINTTPADVDRLVDAVARIAAGEPPPVEYRQDLSTGDFVPASGSVPWLATNAGGAPGCSPG